jgi:ubiquinone/menaquinone biosynthesis C-methylase UbiE
MDNLESATPARAASGAFSNSPMEATFSNRADVWDQLLLNQVKLFSNDEIRYLHGLPEWRSVTAVADVGCGNGDYLEKVRRAFPDREYWGIDTSAQLLDIARRKHAGTGLSFVHQNIECECSATRYDAIILRFVVQHLSNPGPFFKHLARLAHRRSIILVIEPNFALCGMRPQLDSLAALINRYNDMCDRLGNSRSRLSTRKGLSELAGADWSVARHDTIFSRHSRATWDAEAVHQVLRGWCLALAASDPFRSDSLALVRDIAVWIARTGERLEMALNVCQLIRRTSRPIPARALLADRQ